jgi:hypothetical protein
MDKVRKPSNSARSHQHATLNFKSLLPILASYLKGVVGEKYFTNQLALFVWQGIQQTVNQRNIDKRSESDRTILFIEVFNKSWPERHQQKTGDNKSP